MRRRQERVLRKLAVFGEIGLAAFVLTTPPEVRQDIGLARIAAFRRSARESVEAMMRSVLGLADEDLLFLFDVFHPSGDRRPNTYGPHAHVFVAPLALLANGTLRHLDLDALEDPAIQSALRVEWHRRLVGFAGRACRPPRVYVASHESRDVPYVLHRELRTFPEWARAGRESLPFTRLTWAGAWADGRYGKTLAQLGRKPPKPDRKPRTCSEPGCGAPMLSLPVLLPEDRTAFACHHALREPERTFISHNADPPPKVAEEVGLERGSAASRPPPIVGFNPFAEAADAQHVPSEIMLEADLSRVTLSCGCATCEPFSVVTSRCEQTLWFSLGHLARRFRNVAPLARWAGRRQGPEHSAAVVEVAERYTRASAALRNRMTLVAADLERTRYASAKAALDALKAVGEGDVEHFRSFPPSGIARWIHHADLALVRDALPASPSAPKRSRTYARAGPSPSLDLMLDSPAIHTLLHDAIRDVAAEIARAARGGGTASLAGPVLEVTVP